MTILLLIASEGCYGAENMVITLATALRTLGHKCVLGILSDARGGYVALSEAAQGQHIPVEHVPCEGRLDFGAIARSRSLVKRYDAELVHSHGYKSDIYAYAASLGTPFTLVATSHNWPSPLLRMRAYAVADRQVLRKFDRVAVVS